jgi:hypothetical protein
MAMERDMDDKKRTPEEVEQAKRVFFEEIAARQGCAETEEDAANLWFMLDQALDDVERQMANKQYTRSLGK